MRGMKEEEEEKRVGGGGGEGGRGGGTGGEHIKITLHSTTLNYFPHHFKFATRSHNITNSLGTREL